ncbi:MAG: PstS family phosphate ABC transporter substrate-binding protein [Chloroflexi bacterium]|nr:PstS family phosphate ABC transporter substrate-binding protein [Chloroflexota bacterium]
MSLLLLSCGQAGLGQAGQPGSSIQIKGSDTMVNLGQAWAEEFMIENKSVGIAVTGGGSGTGIAAMINGTTDIAQSSRQMKQEEIESARKNGVEPQEFKVALDGLAVVVNPANPVNELTMDQLRDIFMGTVTNWSEVGGREGRIVVLSRESNSGTHLYFKEHVLRRGNEKGPEEFAPRALLMPSSQAIADEVATNRNAIGYYGLGYVGNRQKALAIAPKPGAKAVLPTVATVVSGDYPISRPLFWYTRGKPEGTVRELVEFSLSDEGQQIVLDLDFVPLRKVGGS